MKDRNSGEQARVREKWRDAEAGARYERRRWTSRAKRERDPRLVRALLEQVLGPGSEEPTRILDVPCGTGRLRPGLEALGRYTGLDVSLPMLRAGGRPDGLLCGDVERLPFADRSFDVVVCCRLLHHLRDEAQLERALRELVRVSRTWVVASFWDANTLAAWRRSVWPGSRPPRRFARSRALLGTALQQAGAEPVAWRHSLRYVSRQAFVAARRRGEPATSEPPTGEPATRSAPSAEQVGIRR